MPAHPVQARRAISSRCAICQAETVPAGVKRGIRSKRKFSLRQCVRCGFHFVVDPWVDYGSIYDDAYYEGKGSDPLIDFAFEFERPDITVRQYEWRGWNQLVHSESAAPLRWLDFGCGCGSLVRYLHELGRDEVYGFDTGAWTEKARLKGVPMLTEDDLLAQGATFDVITAIDVLEHVPNPVAVLKQLRRLLKPGGRLYPITQNAEIAPRNFARWSYVLPEIHVSFFTPTAMAAALREAGFAAVPLRRGPGWSNILRSRILKNLGVKRVNAAEKLLPWNLLTRAADRWVKMGGMPLGLAV